MANGLVYILTNPCLDGWVKIGMTEREEVEKRLGELNRPTNIPLSYQCYATYEVKNPREVEQCVHRLIDKVNSELHAKEKLSNGKTRKREFFKISPQDAFDILKEVATLRGDLCNLKLYKISDSVKVIEEVDQTIENNKVAETVVSNNKASNKSVNKSTENSDIGKRIEFRKKRRRISRVKALIPESLYKFI